MTWPGLPRGRVPARPVWSLHHGEETCTARGTRLGGDHYVGAGAGTYDARTADNATGVTRKAFDVATGTGKWVNGDKSFGVITQDGGGGDGFACVSSLHAWPSPGFRSLITQF